jgi:hypothetical protein
VESRPNVRRVPNSSANIMLQVACRSLFQHTKQEHMRVIYYEGDLSCHNEWVFRAGMGYFTISNRKELAQVRTEARIDNFRLCSTKPGRTSPKLGPT